MKKLLVLLSVPIVAVTVALAADVTADDSPALAAVAPRVLTPSTRGFISNIVAGETITCNGPVQLTSLRVAVANVTIRGCEFLNATADRSRPATIDGSGSTNLLIENVTIRGNNTQQNQAIYISGGTGFRAINVTCVDPGMDRYFDHCMYLNGAKLFTVDNLKCTAAHGACIHLYSGGATGTVINSDLGRAAWNVVSWGSQNDVVIENSKLHDAIKVENGRGYAVEAASGGRAELRNSLVCNAATAGNVAGKPGINQNGGTFVDGGGNTYIVGACPTTEPPPPPPPPTDIPVTTKCNYAEIKRLSDLFRTGSPNIAASFDQVRGHLHRIEGC